jgi:DNA-binding transcriptional MocR family regulator
MFPALRLAYAIVPRDLIASFVTARVLVDGHPPTLSQMALTEFFADGHFGVHTRRRRELYRGRRDVLVEAWERYNTSSARLGPADAGLHVVAHLPRGMDDRSVGRPLRVSPHGPARYRRATARPILSRPTVPTRAFSRLRGALSDRDSCRHQVPM